MKTVAVLSGKGGVGKSSITASMAVLLANEHKIVAADCDVDAPNLALVLGIKEGNFELLERVETREKVILITEKCSACKECMDSCNFSAVKWDYNENSPVINDLFCTGCGACTVACPENALELEPVENAGISAGETDYGFPVISGQLNIGESGSGKIVTAVKMRALEIAEDIGAHFLIVDSAAGIGCPVIASVRGSDYVILVTEPTPAAFEDLKRAIKVVEHFGIPYGVVINRYDINNKFTEEINGYFVLNNIPILGKIPYNKKFVYALVNLKPLVVFEPEFADIFLQILKKLNDEVII